MHCICNIDSAGFHKLMAILCPHYKFYLQNASENNLYSVISKLSEQETFPLGILTLTTDIYISDPSHIKLGWTQLFCLHHHNHLQKLKIFPVVHLGVVILILSCITIQSKVFPKHYNIFTHILCPCIVFDYTVLFLMS